MSGVKPGRSAPKTSSPARTAVLLLVLNAVPIGTAAYVFFLRQQGKVTLRELPPGSTGTLAGMGAVIFALVLLGWLVFPALRELRAAARSRARGTFGCFFSLLSVFLLLDLALVALLVLSLFAAELYLLARFASSVR